MNFSFFRRCNFEGVTQTFSIYIDSSTGSKSIVNELLKKSWSPLTPAHFFAYLIHPKYRGEKLIEEERESAMEFAKEIRANNLHIAKVKPFSCYLFDEDVVESLQPVDWWLSLKDQIPDFIFDVAQQLRTSSPSSADVEHIFSTFGHVHSTIRNCLGTEKAGKLVFIYELLNK